MRKEIKPRRGSRAMLLANKDRETAKFFAELWGEEIGQVCEDVVENFPERNEEPIFTNKERNKLTSFGQKFVLDYISGMEPVERVCKFALYDMQDLQHNLSKAKSEEQKLFVKSLREVWFSHLKEMMKELKISKETLMTFGLDWKVAKNFYFQTI